MRCMTVVSLVLLLTRLVRRALWSAVIATCAIAFSVSVQAQTQPSADCLPIAYLPSMATFGGPSVTAAGDTELGLGFGGYSEILPNPCIHAGAEDWLMRFRRAMTDRLDFGFDILTNIQADHTLGGTPKIAVRYLMTSGLRLEGGVGVADGGDGRNLNADVAAVLGTHNQTKTWNYYTSLRLAGSRGCISCGTNTNHAPGALVPLGVIGTTARVSDSMKFVIEAGTGEICARQYSASANYVHLSFGVLFSVRKESHAANATP
jgi:hypothetical protein